MNWILCEDPGSGEVQTNEEAEVYVYDLDLFATVQLLDDTPLSSITWSGPAVKIHTRPKRRRTFYAKAEHFAPLVVPGLSSNSGTSSSPPQDSYIFKSSIRAILRTRSRILVRLTKNSKHKIKRGHHSSLGRPVARSSRMVRGVHRKTRYRSACTRTHFSGLRFGTSCESGTQEAQCLHSLPKRPKL